MDCSGGDVDIEGVDAQRVRAKLLMRAGGLREDQHTRPLIDHRPLFRDEVHSVQNRIDKQNVIRLECGNRSIDILA